MKCPGCKKEISSPEYKCGLCSYEFGKDIKDKLVLYFDLKNELEYLSNISSHFQEKTSDFSKMVSDHEELLNKEFERLSRQKPVKEPEQPTVPVIEQKMSTLEAEANSEKILKTIVEKPAPQFEINFGQKWLLIIGLITTVFGVAYFLKYSFDKGWVGPEGRVAMAYIWGMIFLFAGSKFKKRFENFGLAIIGGGIATLYFATFAGFHIYHLMPQPYSFVIMILITVLASILSIKYDTLWLAVLGIIGGFATPLLLSTGVDNQMALMTYMTILNLGLLSIAFYKKWRLINTLGFIFTYLLYSGWYFNHYDHYKFTKFWPAIIFLNIFYIIYSILPFAYEFFRRNKENIKGFGAMTLNSLIAFGFSYFMIKERFGLEWISVATISYSIIFLSMAYYLFKKNLHQQDAFTILLAKSSLFLIITIPIIFSKHWITVFWAAQAIVLLWAAIRLNRTSIIGAFYVLLLVAIGKFLIYDYPVIFSFDLGSFSLRIPYMLNILERYVTILFIFLMLAKFAYMLKKASVNLIRAFKNDSVISYALLGIVLFIVLNIETSSFFYEYLRSARFAAISVLWTVFAVAIMIKGFRDNNSAVRKTSLALFAVTILKVFMFDLSNVSTPYRIISFIILGLMLVGTSYLYHKFKDRIVSALSNNIEDKGNQQ